VAGPRTLSLDPPRDAEELRSAGGALDATGSGRQPSVTAIASTPGR
jgi:hypothetical protein